MLVGCRYLWSTMRRRNLRYNVTSEVEGELNNLIISGVSIDVEISGS